MTQTELKFADDVPGRAQIWTALNGRRWDELQPGRRVLPERRPPELVVPGPNLTREELEIFLTEFFELARPKWKIRLTQPLLTTAVHEVCRTLRYRRFIDHARAIAQSIQPPASHRSSRPKTTEITAMNEWLQHVRYKLSVLRP